MSNLLLDGEVAQPDPSHLAEDLHALREEFEDFVRQMHAVARELQEQIAEVKRGLRIAAGDALAPDPSGDPRLQSLDKWGAIKQRLGGKEAELIDVLLMSGPRTNTQLKPLLKLAYSTVCALTLKMSNMGFLTKQGDSWALKG